MRINPDTLLPEPDPRLDPRKVTADDLPIMPIEPLPSARGLRLIKTLPEWALDTPPPEVNISVFDRVYLIYDQTIVYSKLAITILRVAVSFILFIQGLKGVSK